MDSEFHLATMHSYYLFLNSKFIQSFFLFFCLLIPSQALFLRGRERRPTVENYYNLIISHMTEKTIKDQVLSIAGQHSEEQECSAGHWMGNFHT